MSGTGNLRGPSMRQRIGDLRDGEVLAHDVLQPAATINALLAVMRSSGELSPAMLEIVGSIDDELRHLVGLCRRALDGGRSSPQVTALDLIAAAVVHGARASWPGTLVLDAGPVEVRADASDLRRALGNLVANACRAAGEGGRVEVRIVVDCVVRIEVHDSGPGFGRAQSGLASVGLDVVRRVARQSHGRVVIGVSPLGGACVTMELPPADSSPAGLPPAVRQPRAG